MYRIALFFLLLIFFQSCGKKKLYEDSVKTSDVQLSVSITRLENEMFKLKDTTEIRAFLDKYPDFSQQSLRRDKQRGDSLLVKAIYAMITNEFVDSAYHDVEKKFADFSGIKKDFEEAFKHIKHYYPDFKAPKIYTVVSGLGSFFGNDLYVSDSMIVVSLDFFMGKDARYRPPVEQMPNYIWRRYQPSSIVPGCVDRKSVV